MWINSGILIYTCINFKD